MWYDTCVDGNRVESEARKKRKMLLTVGRLCGRVKPVTLKKGRSKTKEREGSMNKTVKHENPYRGGSKYHLAFGMIQRKQILTRSEVVEFLMGKGVVSTGKGKDGNEAALATATVLLSPREKNSKRGDCRGNLSAMGHLYFMQPLKKIKGEEKKFRLRWRTKALARRDYERPSTIAAKKEVKSVKQEKTPASKASSKVAETATA